MPSLFDISVATNTVKLDNKREGVATFTVKNNTRRRLHATAKLTTVPPDGATWLTILPPAGAGTPPEVGGTDSASVRDYPIDGTQQYQVKIAVPMDAPPASYTMKLTVSDEVNPDDNFTDSPDVMFTVPEIVKPQPRPFPVWIIPAIIIAVLVIVAIVAVAIVSNNNANANATATAVEAARQTSDAQTAIAGDLTLQATQTAVAAAQTAAAQTAVAQQTSAAQTAVAQQTAGAQTATQAALNVFLGNWLPVSGSSGVIEALAIASSGNNQVSVSYTGRCPPNQNLCFTVSQTFTFTNVPFNSTQLAAGGTVLRMLIVPANNGQLLVTVQQGAAAPTLQQFRRRGIRDDLTFNAPIVIGTSIFSDLQIDNLRRALTPGP